ncbi:MAG: aminotransferase class III-fold pyridoxal phosphate-dependent enzyme, partial [Candidatus Omnitrophota bacterium]
VPVGLTRVFYSDNGSTAVEAALKISYQYWQNLGKGEKGSFIYFDNSYHGDTLGAVAVGGIDLFHRIYRRLLFKAYRLPLALSRVEEFIKKRHSRIAAVIIEPLIQAAGGMLLAPQGFLRGLRRICSHYRVLLIADEVAVGFGRTGTMFACEQEAVRPDILCLAKGLSGGYLPLAATLTTEKIYAAFLERGRDKARCRPPGPKTFFHGHSYTANPLACAAALASLRIFRQQRVLEKLPAKIGLFNRCLRRFSALPCVKQVRHKGLIAGIDLDGDDDIGVKVIKEARRRGAILRPLGRVIVLMPPLSITNRELKRLLDITYHSILYRSKDAGEGR